MRLFVALEVPAEVRAPLDAAVAPLRAEHDRLRWTPAEQWHITLAFIGDVDAAVDAVVAALEAAADAAPDRIGLDLAAPGRFGDRVLWVGVTDEPEEAVADLGAATQRSLAAAGIPSDDKPVHPHVTLARGRRRGRARIRPTLVEAVASPSASWSVDEMLLVESVRQGHGRPNRYEARARIGLGG